VATTAARVPVSSAVPAGKKGVVPVTPAAPRRITSRSDIPPFKQVLTSARGGTPLSTEQQRDLVALALGDDHCMIIANVSGNDVRAEISSLRDRLKKRNYARCDLALADPGMISSLYEGVSNDGDKAGEDVSELSTSAAESMFDALFAAAIKRGASDVHITLDRTQGRAYIDFRVYGELFRYSDGWSYAKGVAFARATYGTICSDRQCTEDSSGWNERTEQDANAFRVVDGVPLQVRYSHAPLRNGVHVAFRVLHNDASNAFRPLDELGYAPEQARLMMFALSRPGVIFLVGETGSGKTTTIRHLLEHYGRMHGGRVNILTAESPPEYVIPYTKQSPQGKRSERNPEPMPSLIRSMMRRDPDLIMVGEVRDEITAKTLAWATQSGHPVVTTAHAGSPIGLIPRLEGLGLNRMTLRTPGFLNLVVYQRLLPVLCPKCSVPYLQARNAGKVSRGLCERVESVVPADDLGGIRLRGKGCPHCKNLGIRGQTVCAETMMFDYQMLEFIGKGDDIGAMRHWRHHAGQGGYSVGQSALTHAISKMRKGLVSPHAIESAFTSLAIDAVMEEGILSATELQKMLNA